MMKVLVVDDDKLARQGLILSVRWEDFGMKVVGEAPNGVKALQFLDANPVDLVLTDLAMPLMSGIELMKQAKVKHRQVLFVVLTFHEDFETTREALRLGAIDYISKLQLEKENLDSVLGRIRDRIAGDQPGAARGGASAQAYFAVGRQADPRALEAALADDGVEAEELGPGGYVCFGAEVPDLGLPGWLHVRVDGLLGESRARVASLLRQYQGGALFYDHTEGQSSLTLGFGALEAGKTPPPAEAELSGLRARLTAMEWMHRPAELGGLMAELRALRLPYLTLIRLLAAVESEWNRIYGPWSTHVLELPEAFLVLADVEAWLRGVGDYTYGFGPLKTQSREAQTSILKALQILHTEYDRPLHAAEIAQRVNMSRSHFCFCFKEIVGEPFLDHLSTIRLEKAKDLLVRFDWAIYEVAARTGYADDRYFSRLFKKATGVLPSEYRRLNVR